MFLLTDAARNRADMVFFFLRIIQSPANAFLTRIPDHLWLAHDRRSREHIRNALIMRQRPHTDLARRARRRNEDLSRTMRQNRRYASFLRFALY